MKELKGSGQRPRSDPLSSTPGRLVAVLPQETTCYKTRDWRASPFVRRRLKAGGVRSEAGALTGTMRLKFGDCVLDLRARQLERANKVVPLEPKMYELLEVLIKRRPAVVTNNELDELLWPNVYVERTSLTRLVSELRAVLGDTPRDSRIIRTAYKAGYAFCADVTCLPAAPAPAAAIEVLWMKQSLPLTDGEHIAGRDAECSLVVDGTTVSRRHARITVAHGTAMIEDLGSTNGTHVNGKRISAPTRLAPGDEFSLGSEVLRVRLRSSSALTVKVDSSTKPSAEPQIKK
jgi:DNA-binding winged helix-turn-helix (wHTH) protein